MKRHRATQPACQGGQEFRTRTFVAADQGAALVTVLLFMVLTFILTTTMLTVLGNETIIAGVHRDGVRAMDLAQAGVQEAIVRIQQGRPYMTGFTSSLNPGVQVSVVRHMLGTNAVYEEIRARATVGRATRNLSALVLSVSKLFPPSITFADNVTEQGNGSINAGDAYARTFFAYKKSPTPDLTYAGWYISKAPPGAVSPCYTHLACVAAGMSNWYPGTRGGEPQATPLGLDVSAQTNKCPAGGGGLLPTDTVTGILQTDPTMTTVTIPAYGFDTDFNGGTNYAVSQSLPCGLPYKYTVQQVQGQNILFKNIVYEQWLGTYWRFDEGVISYVKQPSLLNHPEFGSVPPFPNVSALEGNYDYVYSGGSMPNGLGTTQNPLVILLQGDWHFAGQITGAGTLVVEGNLQVDGQFTYNGLVIVNGEFVQGAGNANITGGLVARNTLLLSGNFSVTGGVTAPSVPVGPTIVSAKAWWER